jgi:hypothetical protein
MSHQPSIRVINPHGATAYPHPSQNPEPRPGPVALHGEYRIDEDHGLWLIVSDTRFTHKTWILLRADLPVEPDIRTL